MRPFPLIAALAAIALAACQAPPGGFFGGGYPPDRTAWASASPAAQAEHARTVHLALETAASAALRWSADGTTGAVFIERQQPAHGTVCAIIRDQITSGGKTDEVRDVACWSDGWRYIRDPKPVDVLAPAFAEEERVYTVKSGGSLLAIARRTDSDLALLLLLNPAYPPTLPAGTRILLP